LLLKTYQSKIGSCHRLQVGWFLHTPFPSSEIYRTLPVREEVLRAVLKADLIGFHTYDYARHFVSACTRILGLEVWLNADSHFELNLPHQVLAEAT
jgi:trehalose-6-phosphate synthase